MIMIEVKVPMMGKYYDFQIDENALAGEITVDIADLVCRREQCAPEGDESELMLWELSTRRRLDNGKTAAENGLQTGSRLMLL